MYANSYIVVIVTPSNSFNRSEQWGNIRNLKPGVGQNIAPHASATARNFLLIIVDLFPVYSSSFFQNTLSTLFNWRNSLDGARNKIGHRARRHNPLMQVPVFRACGMV